MKIPEPYLPPNTDVMLARALVPLLRSIAIKLHQLGDGLLQGRDDVRTAAPTSGTWARGDQITNSQPAELGAAGSRYVITGWICVTGGTPGTWLQMRTLTGN